MQTSASSTPQSRGRLWGGPVCSSQKDGAGAVVCVVTISVQP
jgi:hypothetical protein